MTFIILAEGIFEGIQAHSVVALSPISPFGGRSSRQRSGALSGWPTGDAWLSGLAVAGLLPVVGLAVALYTPKNFLGVSTLSESPLKYGLAITKLIPNAFYIKSSMTEKGVAVIG